MAEQRTPPPSDLDQALRDLGPQVAFPPTPPLAASVAERLRSGERRRLGRPGWLGRLVLAGLVVVLLFGALLLLAPPVRTAVADALGLRGVIISFVPAVPTPTPTPAPAAPSPTPVPVGVRLRLGTSLTLAQARQQAAFTVRTPALPALGEPDEVYLDPTLGQLALVYRARPGFEPADATGVSLLLTQAPGVLDVNIFGKGLGPGTTLTQVTVNGARGLWIEGQPHTVFYFDPSGTVRTDTVRLAGNVLVWQEADVLYRLEGAATRELALQIAASLR